MYVQNSPVIQGYEVLERIGSGGFGTVYRARQKTINREVAIKFINPHHTNKPEFIRRFDTEAEIIARLEHPHIIPLIDYWRDSQGAYLVMRYVRAGSVRDALQNDTFQLETISDLLDQISSALAFAHQRDIIHRDIKPDNVLLDEDGNAYLADFGIAKDLQLETSHTEPESIVGSLDYISPEQARNDTISVHTDIYSVGVMLYELITGEHPFDNVSIVERLYKHINDPLPFIETLPDSVTDDVNAVIQTATEKDPSQRYDDILALALKFRQATGQDARTAQDEKIVEQLTMREHEILQLIADGMTNREISENLYIAVSTVRWNIRNIYKKLGVRSRVQATIRARELKLIITGQVAEIKADDQSVGSTSVSLPEPENPYKGLHAFGTADARDFYGQEDFIKKLIGSLQGDGTFRRFLAVVGPSGSGKSSLVKAGLIPALWKGGLPGSEKWFVVDMSPGVHPIDELEIALTRVAANQSDNLNSHLNRDERGLIRAAELILPKDDTELVVIIDQFEELFTLVDHEANRQHFLNLLQTAVTDKRSRVRVILTLRADYYDKPLHYPDFGEMLRQKMHTILPLSAEGLERAIRKPAERVGIQFEEGLVAQIVSEITYQTGALPLLQYALTELFEQREERRITKSAYENIGGAIGALANRADEVFLSFSESEQDLLQQMFLRLVTIGENIESTRRRTLLTELLSLSESPDTVEEIVDTFANYRLMTLDHEPHTHRPTVEVAHEALLNEWDRLRNWLNKFRDDIRQERLLGRAAIDWDSHDRDVSYLLRGSRLEQIENWQSTTAISMTRLEQQFIDRSIAERRIQQDAEAERQIRETKQQKRSQMLLRALVAVFALATLLSSGFGVFALTARNAEIDARQVAEVAEQDALTQAGIGLAAQAQLELQNGRIQRAILLGLEALENYPYTWQAESALFTAIHENHIDYILNGHASWVLSVAWSADGSRLVTTSTDTTARVWDTATGDELLILDGHEGNVVDAFWSPDESKIGTISYAEAIIWDAHTGEEIMTLHHGDAVIWELAWSPDGNKILTVAEDQRAKVWDAHTGEELATLSTHTGIIEHGEWSPDGSQFATASWDNTTRIWDAETYEEVFVLIGNAHPEASELWSPDGSFIATDNAEENLITIWDATTGEILHTLPGEAIGVIRSVTWSPDSMRILATEDGDKQGDGVAAIWDVMTGDKLFVLPANGSDIWVADWSSDSSQVAVRDQSNVIRIWDAQTGNLIHELRRPGVPWHIEWESDSNRLATSYIDGTVIIWDTTDTATLRIPHQSGGTVDWSPDGQYVLRSEITDSELIVANSVTGKGVMTLPTEELVSASWSPDGNLIGTTHLDGTVRIWNYDTGEERLHVRETEGIDRDEYGPFWVGPYWSPDSHQFAVVHRATGHAYVFLTETGEYLHTFGEPSPFIYMCHALWSPDGERLATGTSDGFVRILDASTFEEVLSVEVGDWPCGMDWSPDGTQLVVSLTNEGVIHVLDAQAGEIQLTYERHTGTVGRVDWSPNGTRILSGGQKTRIWDATTGYEYGVLSGVGDGKWSPDGSRFFTIGSSNTLRIWQTIPDTESLIAYAKDCCVFRDFTETERTQFGLSAP